MQREISLQGLWVKQYQSHESDSVISYVLVTITTCCSAFPFACDTNNACVWEALSDSAPWSQSHPPSHAYAPNSTSIKAINPSFRSTLLTLIGKIVTTLTEPHAGNVVIWKAGERVEKRENRAGGKSVSDVRQRSRKIPKIGLAWIYEDASVMIEHENRQCRCDLRQWGWKIPAIGLASRKQLFEFLSGYRLYVNETLRKIPEIGLVHGCFMVCISLILKAQLVW